jgi:hypothetical protein
VESGDSDRDFIWKYMLNHGVKGKLLPVDLGLKSAA